MVASSRALLRKVSYSLLTSHAFSCTFQLSLLEFGEYLVKHPKYGKRVVSDTAAASAAVGDNAGAVGANTLGSGASADAKAGGDWVSKWLVPNLKRMVGVSVEAMAMAIAQQRQALRGNASKRSRESRNVQREKPRKGQHINDGMELNQQLAMFGSDEEEESDDEGGGGGGSESMKGESTDTIPRKCSDADELAELHEAMLTSKEPLGRGRGGGGFLSKDMHLPIPKPVQPPSPTKEAKKEAVPKKKKVQATKEEEEEEEEEEAGKGETEKGEKGKAEKGKAEKDCAPAEEVPSKSGAEGGSTSANGRKSRRKSTDSRGPAVASELKPGLEKKWKRPPPGGSDTTSPLAVTAPLPSNPKLPKPVAVGRLPSNCFELLG
jgi:hypothetical protein